MRLLIVEDNADLADALQAAFARRSIPCDFADCAGDAAQLIGNTAYSVVILDLGLPDEDGLQLLRRLRAEGRVEPVIILTARSAPEMRIEGLRGGADDYLVKPFLFDELHARIEAILRRQGGYVRRCIEVGDVALDTETREVSVCGAQVEMSAREVELLEILLRRHSHVTPKRLLEDQLFGPGEALGSNAVEVYVHRIRKKLESVSQNVTVKTVRGVGYLLMAR